MINDAEKWRDNAKPFTCQDNADRVQARAAVRKQACISEAMRVDGEKKFDDTLIRASATRTTGSGGATWGQTRPTR
eukprot:1775678-Pyramimonas_sp.AAC.1